MKEEIIRKHTKEGGEPLVEINGDDGISTESWADPPKTNAIPLGP